MNILNQYSYVLLSFSAIAVCIGVLLRLRVNWRLASLAGLLLTVLLTSGFLLLRPGDGDVDSLAEAEAVMNNGRPTFLEFFSNYCAGCLTLRPTIDSLASSISDDFNILRVDIHADWGRQFRERYGFAFTPEFVLFDASGNEVWRSHVPPTQVELDQVLQSEQM